MNVIKHYSMDVKLGLFLLFTGLFKINPRFNFSFFGSLFNKNNKH